MINLYCIRPKGFNIGNDVIHLALNHFIKSSFNQNLNIISIPATSKYESQKKAGLNPQTIYEINQFGHGLIIGGGNLYENGELEINQTALKALDVPFMIFSLSRGKIYNKKLELVDRTDVMTDNNIIAINKKADISLSRDIATHEYIKNLGCDNILGGCPTLFINEIPQHLVPISEVDKTDALISIRTPGLMSIPVENQYALRDQLLNIISNLKDKGYNNIKFLCHDHRDIPFATSFKEIKYLFTDDVYTYLTYLKNTRLNISYRLHSFLPALAMDVPTIKLSYDQRALSMLETVGMNEWNINILKQDSVEEVKKRIRSLGDLNNIKKDLKKDLWPKLRKTIVSNFNKYADLVQSQI
ncbi:MAG: polysaccharide pyruvyl transferase family protein [Bacteroidales bacterium]|nr:polysaccharide pyruvyl transferase family protein [Bacteroidales bacterium]